MTDALELLFQGKLSGFVNELLNADGITVTKLHLPIQYEFSARETQQY